MPDIQNIYPFGCRAFLLKPSSNKLESKAIEGIYVGTEFTGGHLILNVKTGRIITRRDIQVHENNFPLPTQIPALRANNRRILKNALSGPRSKDWMMAIKDQMANMAQNNLWTLVSRSVAQGKLMCGR
ncbi:hypothetical protein K3495_g2508 [Podosphaera aphanis]|nr:hypothetical protein K3495_g2508 [Podosphaera aphanis]